MEKLILIAGATGNLGLRICRELTKRNVALRALVRNGTDQQKIDELESLGVDVFTVDFSNEQELIGACRNVSCVISALAGLRDVIVDMQGMVLKAAIAAKVPRFIPSDFSSDFSAMPFGENRNFDLRKEFHELLNSSPILATSILNGAFADILKYNIPLYNKKAQTIAYYENKEDWKIDFTTMDDTAAFTAMAALDDNSPRYLPIASFSVSPKDLADLSKVHAGAEFELVDMGTMDQFSAQNRQFRAANPEGELELYPRWQQAQYLYSMFAISHQPLDNDRYEGLSWSPAIDNI